MTEYLQLVSNDNLPSFPTPFVPDYPVAFDQTFDTKGFSEMRVWIWISVTNQSTPVTANSTLEVRFLHQFDSKSLDYEKGTITGTAGFHAIYGYVAKPIIGDQTRIICHPTNMPQGPYNIRATCYLVP